MEKTKQHVEVPNPKEPIKKGLKPIDYLVYANIRRFMNKDTMSCYPSINTIAECCRCNRKTVMSSIKRLEDANYMQVIRRRGASTIYKFDKLSTFEMFTPEFLDNLDMSPEEKAYLIGLQSQSYKNEDYAITTYSNAQLSENLNIPERTIRRYNKSLKEKDIMLEIDTQLKDEAGFNVPAKAVDLHKIGQAILFICDKVDEHENRITRLEKMIDLLAKENKSLKRENDLLRNSKMVEPIELEF